MAGLDKFKLPKWGPPKLRRIWEQIEDRMNAITPRDGLGTEVDSTAGGTQVNVSAGASGGVGAGVGEGGPTGGSSGTPVNVYGAVNGAPGVFHLLQSSPPTPV